MTTLTSILLATTYISFLWAFGFYFQRRGNFKKASVNWLAVLGVLFMGSTILALYQNGAAIGFGAWFGQGFLLLSLILFWSAIWSHKKNPPLLAFTDATATTFTHSGPYRFIRHPFYTSYSIAWVGAVLATASWASIGPAMVMIALYQVAARAEEAQFLSSPFKDQYKAYQSKTGMFLPGI